MVLSCYDWDHTVDIWSLGCVLFELWSGDLLFSAREDHLFLALVDRLVGEENSGFSWEMV